MQNLADFLARSNGVKFYFIGDEDFQIQAETSIFHFKVILTFIFKYSTFMRGLMCFGSELELSTKPGFGNIGEKSISSFFRWRHPDHGQPVHTKLCKNRRRQNGVQCTDYIQVIFLITSRFLSLTQTFQAKMVRWPFDLFTQVGQGRHERYVIGLTQLIPRHCGEYEI